MNVLHLSKTPLAGSPGRISKNLNKIGVISNHFFEQDYPGDLATKMTMRSYHWTKSKESNELLEFYISTADIIHVHNYISSDLCSMINRFFNGKKCILHIHSPLREGPLFTNIANIMDIAFTDFFVVAQYHPRQYQEFTPICNVVPDAGLVNSLNVNNEIPKVIYSPAHNRTNGKWNIKHSEKFNNILNHYDSWGKISLKKPPKMSESKLLAYRSICDVSIDEVVTGSYHQVSLEGLSAGNIVINNADFFSIEMLKLAIKTNENPPFYLVNDSNCHEKMNALVKMSFSEIFEYKERSRDYFNKYLSPTRLSNIIVERYEM